MLGASELIDTILANMGVTKLWGIGKRWGETLNRMGYMNSLDLKKAGFELIRSKFNIVLARTVKELNHLSCIDIDDLDVNKKQIVVSKSFGEKQTDFEPIAEALANYVSRAAQKLRKQQSACGALAVFLQTNLMNQDEKKYRNSFYIKLDYPTSDTRILLKQAQAGLKKIFVSGFRYKKVGVLLDELQDLNSLQLDIFQNEQLNNSESMMALIDAINAQCGKNSIQFAAQGFKKAWQMKQERHSQVSVTNWKALPEINCLDNRENDKPNP